MHLSKLESCTLQNGMKVFWYLIEGTKRVSVSTVIFSGGMQDPKELAGLHHIAEHLPFRGTVSFPSHQHLFYEIEKHDGNINATTSKERTVFICNVPAVVADLASAFIADITFRPLCRTEDWEIEREVILEEYNRSLNNKDFVTATRRSEEIYGKESPAAKSPLGNPETIGRIEIEHIRKMYCDDYTANNCCAIIVGDFTEKVIRKALAQFGSLEIPTGKDKRLKIQMKSDYSKEIIIQHPLFQSPHVEWFVPFNYTDVRQRHLMYLYRTMMSVQFSSPTFNELRAKRGLFYVGNVFADRVMGAGFILGFACNTKISKLPNLKSEFWNIHQKYLHDPVRFDFARTRFILRNESDTESVGGITDDIIGKATRNEWIDDEEYLQIVKDIQHQEIIDFVGTHFQWEKAVTLIATT